MPTRGTGVAMRTRKVLHSVIFAQKNAPDKVGGISPSFENLSSNILLSGAIAVNAGFVTPCAVWTRIPASVGEWTLVVPNLSSCIAIGARLQASAGTRTTSYHHDHHLLYL